MQLMHRHTSRSTRMARSGFVSGMSAVSLFSLALISGPSDGMAQTAAEVRSKLQQSIVRREKARATLERNRKYLNENRERVGALKDEMARLDKERAAVTNADLIRTGEKVQQTKAKMTAIEGRLVKLEVQERRLRTSLNTQHRSINGLLSAIQRMGRNPPPVGITRRADALKMVRSAMLLAHAFPELRGKALALSRQLNRLVALMDGIRQEREQLRAEAKRLNEAQTRLSLLLKKKRKSFGDRTVELAEVNRTAKVIGRNVKSLEGLISNLGPAIARDTKIGRKLEAAARRKAVAHARAVAIAREKAQADKLRKLQLALSASKGAQAGDVVSIRIVPAKILPDPASRCVYVGAMKVIKYNPRIVAQRYYRTNLGTYKAMGHETRASVLAAKYDAIYKGTDKATKNIKYAVLSFIPCNKEKTAYIAMKKLRVRLGLHWTTFIGLPGYKGNICCWRSLPELNLKPKPEPREVALPYGVESFFTPHQKLERLPWPHPLSCHLRKGGDCVSEDDFKND